MPSARPIAALAAAPLAHKCPLTFPAYVLASFCTYAARAAPASHGPAYRFCAKIMSRAAWWQTVKNALGMDRTPCESMPKALPPPRTPSATAGTASRRSFERRRRRHKLLLPQRYSPPAIAREATARHRMAAVAGARLHAIGPGTGGDEAVAGRPLPPPSRGARHHRRVISLRGSELCRSADFRSNRRVVRLSSAAVAS